MKKLLLASLVIFAFAACSSDKNDDNEKRSLKGTKWEYSDDIATLTFEFTTDSKYKFTEVYYDPGVIDVNRTVYGEYSYKHPSVIINMGDGRVNATINGNNQLLIPLDGGGAMLVFYKQ